MTVELPQVAPFVMRQSTLATFSRCPLSARFEIEAGERHAPQLTRGSLFHRIIEKCLAALRASGESQIPQQEAVEIMYEVLAEADQPRDEREAHGPGVLSPTEREALRQLVVRWATDRSWTARQILGLEVKLHTDIVCQDGVVRRVTGTPDVILAEPPDGVIVYDAKSGWGPPASPRSGEVEAAGQGRNARRYLTERGHYQLDCYGLLVMENYPAVQRVTLREDHPRVNEVREASLHRDELEHVRRLIGIDLMLIEKGLEEGDDSSVWKPEPGKQCDWCIRSRDCPRPVRERGNGSVESPELALTYALDIEVLTAQRKHTIDAAKAWVDANGPVPLPDGRVLGWEEKEKDGKVRRSFCAHFPA